MTDSASWQLQQALFTLLTNDAPLTTLLGGAKIYDHTPQRTRPPYVTIGLTTTRDWSTSTEQGREHIVTLHSWTDSKTRQAATAIQNAIEQSVLPASLTMDDHTAVSVFYEFSEIRRDPDGETLHGITRFRIRTEPHA